MELTVKPYVASNGICHFERWRRRLDVTTRVRIDTAVARLRGGNTSNVKWFDGIGEAKLDFGPGYRLYLLRDGDALLVLLCGGDKGSQKDDIKLAKKLAKEYREGK